MQQINVELQTAVIIITSLVAGVFTLAGVVVGVYVSIRVKLTQLDVHVDILRKDINNIGMKLSKFIDEKH
jgi:uncharacterized protein YneF (UPF0154 family)